MNRYRITVESMPSGAERLQFEVENHDDIAAIARKTPSRFGLSEDDTKALVIGFTISVEEISYRANAWNTVPLEGLSPDAIIIRPNPPLSAPFLIHVSVERRSSGTNDEAR